MTDVDAARTATDAVVLGAVGLAPPERTLVDILAATAEAHPHAPAIDDGRTTLTYAELTAVAGALANLLAGRGIGRGDRVGIRLPSGSYRLYAAIVGVLMAGAAYVPVDADDPQERADLVFGEAGVKVVLDDESTIAAPSDAQVRGAAAPSDAQVRGAAAPPPCPADDAWVIFTSGSTGVPKGVAVSHRSAAAFVDAEARLFLPDDPINESDRVMAGLSVAFDASCEEMWLAWRNGACLVPAPRSLVRSGIDLGTWLIERQITVVSTVPTLAALWPVEALDSVRLLIFGGEACSPELADRLVDDGREVWNTYGPTEATVVACASRLAIDQPVRIGLPLDGWLLAVVDGHDLPVTDSMTGQLIIGGVGLARYLDADKDAEKYAPMPSLGWDRAYRSGDLVRLERDGLLFVGRVDDQVKVGGRRIELGEVEAALMSLDGVAGAAAAVRRSPAGTPMLVGYVVATHPGTFDPAAASALLRARLPAALVPALALVEALPTRVSGKVDRDALPWPLPGVQAPAGTGYTPPRRDAWLAGHWTAVLGTPLTAAEDDFFAHGGGSLTAAQLVSLLRERNPRVTVGDVYQHPRFADLAALLADARTSDVETTTRAVRPTSLATQLVQIGVTAVVATLTGLQWLIVVAAANNVMAWFSPRPPWAPTVSWWWIAGAGIVLLSPFGRMAIAAASARLLLRGVTPGSYPRGGSTHLRLWTADRLADGIGAVNLAGAPWIAYYARALGAKVGRNVDLHTVPPITGMLTLGAGCAIEPEVDLSGHWLDGDVLHVGPVAVGPGARVGSRSTLGPGATIGRDAEIEPGSFVSAAVPAGERWAGSPATRVGTAGRGWPDHRPPAGRHWPTVYGVTSFLFSALPLVAALPALVLLYRTVRGSRGIGSATLRALAVTPVVTLVWFVTLAACLAGLVRLLGVGVRAGEYPVRSRVGWQVWATERLMDSARTLLFPIYASLATPVWLRLLGADVGREVEASTVLLLPKMTSIGDRAFVADDTMVGSYEMRRGWLRIEPARVGKRAFLGNSGITAPGRSVPNRGLVAVLSTAPPKAKKGSSWLGSPPIRMRRAPDEADLARTFRPPLRLKFARAAVETCRLVPTMCTVGIGIGVTASLEGLVGAVGYAGAALLGGVVVLAAGAAAAVLTVAAKWLLVGRTDPGEHPLWSSFVWRNEVVDTFVEMVAAPWFARAATGTAVLNVFLRGLGARIGRGVWCESYWLPEADLVELGEGATVNRGCVLQTHLFHDRIMRVDGVRMGAGSTLGPHCVILPAASLGAGATIHPASLVMRGEAVPAGTSWVGNPIGRWSETGA